MPSNAKGLRQRLRQKKAKAKRAEIVAGNRDYQHPKGRPSQVDLSPSGLMAATHTGVRTSIHEGSGVKIIATRGASLGRVTMEGAPTMFGKVAPPKRYYTTAPKSAPFNKDDYDDGVRWPAEGRATIAPWSARALRKKGLR